MRWLKPILGGLLLLMTACASVNVEGNMRPGYTRRLERVCVVVTSMRAMDRPFFEALQGALEQGFRDRGVQSCVRLGPMEPEVERNFWTQKPVGPIPPPPPLPDLDPASLEKSAGFRPVFLLVIRPGARGTSTVTTMGSTPGGVMQTPIGKVRTAGGMSTTTSSMEVHYLRSALTEVEGGLAVWKGEIEMKWNGGAQMFPGFGPRQERPIQVDPAKFTKELLGQLGQNGLLPKS